MKKHYLLIVTSFFVFLFFLNIDRLALAGWEWQNPLTQGNDLNDIWGSSGKDVFATCCNDWCHKDGTGFPSPSAMYCVELGYKYRQINTPEGQRGICIFPIGRCDAWDFYAGKCGKIWSFCVRKGYGVITLTDGKDPFSPEYSACVDICTGEIVGSVTEMMLCGEDSDEDCILDWKDNCPETPNAPDGGTCIKNNIGNPCIDNDDCGIEGFCSRNQEDSDFDGIGDVCDANPLPCPIREIYGGDSNEAEILTIFRDTILTQSPAGREIIRLYYLWSPAVVTAMEEDEKFKEEIKEMINGILSLIQKK